MGDIQSMDAPKPKIGAKTKTGAGIAAMLAIATPFVAGWEGKRNDPYFDSVHVHTVCYGDTQVAMKHYTDAECADLLRDKLEKQYGPKVQAALHGIEDHRYAFAAFTDLAYNAGPGAVQGSIAKLWNSGQYVAACHFISNYKYAGGKVLAGLVYRRDGQAGRIGETDLCMVDAVPLQMGTD